MNILRKKKDYYDFVSHVNGVEDQICYDRREYKDLKSYDALTKWAYSYEMDRYAMKHLSYTRYWREPTKYDVFIMLEAGFVQYIFGFGNVITIRTDNGVCIIDDHQADMDLVHTFNEGKHLYPEYPLSFSHTGVRRAYGRWDRQKKDWKDVRLSDLAVVKNTKDANIFLYNPMLINTKIPGFIKPEVIWQNLRDYLGRLVDDSQGQSTPLTDVEKAINHGFDKVTSFRHPIK